MKLRLHIIKIRLTFICTCSTTFLVLIIILYCLKVSEDNMYGQEQALFLLRANTITSDLHSLEEVSIHWYTKNMNQKDLDWHSALCHKIKGLMLTWQWERVSLSGLVQWKFCVFIACK